MLSGSQYNVFPFCSFSVFGLDTEIYKGTSVNHHIRKIGKVLKDIAILKIIQTGVSWLIS